MHLKISSNHENVHKIQLKKTQTKIARDSMVNSIEERGMNKTNPFHIKVRKYPAASSIDIIDHLKANLRKATDQKIIHAGTNSGQTT